MFSEYISNPFNRPSCNWYFGEAGKGKIPTVYLNDDFLYGSDTTMISTIQYLLRGRVENGTRIDVRVSTGGRYYTAMPTYQRLIGRFLDRLSDETDSSMFIFATDDNPSSLRDGVTENNKDGILTVYDDVYKLKPQITDFFGTKFGVYVFINEEKRSTIVFTSKPNVERYHWLQCVMPMLLPWFWTNEEGKLVVPKEDAEFLETLNHSNEEAYLAFFQKFIDENGIEAQYRREMLKGFLSATKQAGIDDAVRRINNENEEIERYYAEIRNRMRNINELNIRLTGLRALVSEDADNEFVEYIENNEFVEIVEFANRTAMTIGCSGYLTYFDSDRLETYIDNKNSFLYGCIRRNVVSDEDFVTLLKGIFIDQTLKLRVWAPYKIDMSQMWVDGCAGYTNGKDDTHMANPHIYHFSCIGNHKTDMNECLRKGDYIGLIETCIASARNLNFSDSTVCSEFFKDLSSAEVFEHRKYIEAPNGDLMTPKEAVEYLKKGEESNG